MKHKTHLALIYLFFIITSSFISFAKKISMSSVVNRLSRQERPYQVMIFQTNSIENNRLKRVLSLEGVPSINVDNLNLKKQMTTEIQVSMHKSLIIICINDLNEANKYIDLVVEQIPVHRRPKCLILFTKQENNLTQDIQYLLKNAWAHKILDVSIINTENAMYIYHFNPFDSTFKKETYNNHNTIFPDKFKTIKNYPLNVTFSSQNLIQKAKRSPGLSEITKTVDFTVRYMLRLMNFDLKSVKGENRNPLPYHYYDPNSWFLNSHSNAHGFMLRLRSLAEFANLSSLAILPSEQPCRRLVLVAPKFYAISFPSEILVFFFVIPGIIFSFLFVVRKVDIKYKNVLRLTRLLLGQCVNFKFGTLTSRIIFLLMVLFYTLTSNDIYTIIISKNYYVDTFVIKDIDDLAKSRLPIYTNGPLNVVFSTSTKDKTWNMKVRRDLNCITNMVKLKNSVCIVNYLDAKADVNKYRDSEGSPILYIATTYQCDDFYYIFEPASPYTKRFMSVVRRVHASGLLKHEAPLYFGFKRPIQNLEFKAENNKNDISAVKLLLILLFGYFIACWTFILEFILFFKIYQNKSS